MSKTLLYETKVVLTELRNLKKTVDVHRRKFARYDNLTMVNSCHKDNRKQQYYLKQTGVPKRKYLGTDGSEAVKNIKAARYYNKLMQAIDTDIRLLESIERNYVFTNFDTITGLLPKVYRSEAPPHILQGSQAAAKWKEKMEAEKAKHDPFRPEDLKYMAKDRTMMRSLSEVLIANYLLSLGITFVYELPMTVNGKTVRPDFTILSPVDYKTVIIIEHQGAMNSETYQAKFIRTVLFFLGTDLVPNKDVFFTFNHLDGNLDLRQVDYILRMAFGFAQE